MSLETLRCCAADETADFQPEFLDSKLSSTFPGPGGLRASSLNSLLPSAGGCNVGMMMPYNGDGVK